MKNIKFFITILTLIIGFSCDSYVENISDSGVTDKIGNVSISVSQAPEEIAVVIASLSRRGFDERILSLSISDSEQTASGEINNVPIGLWHLRVDALDKEGNVRYIGETDVEVRSGETSVVDLILQSATGNIEIHVSWGKKCVQPPSGLVSWWTGDGTANDKMGTNHGTLMNGASFVDGKVGRAFSLDGVDDYVRILNSPSLNPSGSFTVAAWIFPLRDGHASVFCSWGAYHEWYNMRAWNLAVRPGLKVEFSISDSLHQLDTSYHIFRTHENAIILNKWNFIAGVYDISAGKRQIYVNGKKLAERKDQPTVVTKSSADVTIGTELDSPYRFYRLFQGFIDEVVFFNRALKGGEIKKIFKAGQFGKCK